MQALLFIAHSHSCPAIVADYPIEPVNRRLRRRLRRRPRLALLHLWLLRHGRLVLWFFGGRRVFRPSVGEKDHISILNVTTSPI